MLKFKSIFTISVLSLFIQNAYSLEKNLDFYENTNRYSVLGNLEELKDISYNKKSLIVNEANETTYITLNNTFPNKTYYQNQDLNLVNIINQNKGKIIKYTEHKGQETYKIINFDGVSMVLQNVNTKEYLFINDLKEFRLPQELVSDYEKGLTAFFDKEIKKDDILFYSQIDNNLNYTNNYQIRLLNNDKLKLIHYIDIQNSSSKTYDDVTLSFFFGDMNINNNPIEIRRKSSRIEMAAMNSFNDTKIEFENEDFSNVKVISITKPISIYPNFNRIKYTDNDYTYQLITKVTPITTEYGDIPDDLILESIKNSKIFNNYIEIKRDNTNYIPKGSISVYEQFKDKDKLIVNTNIRSTTNKNIELLKNKNLDLKLTNLNIQKVRLLTEQKNDTKEEIYKKIIKSIKIKNEGNESYKIAKMLENMEYEYIIIKPNEEVELTL